MTHASRRAGSGAHQTRCAASCSRAIGSTPVERELGGRIKSVRGWRVDLEHTELTVRVEILNDEAFCYLRKEQGPVVSRAVSAAASPV